MQLETLASAHWLESTLELGCFMTGRVLRQKLAVLHDTKELYDANMGSIQHIPVVEDAASNISLLKELYLTRSSLCPLVQLNFFFPLD